MAIADTITSMQNHTSNAYTMIGYGTDLTGINKNLENLSSTIFEAFLEALRNPDTLFTNLPKTSGSGSNITLNGTAYAPMRINLNPTAISQDGTPTPDNPQDIHTISGNNSVVVEGKNLAKSFYSPQVTQMYIRNLFIDFNIQPDTTYTFSFETNQSGAAFYWNESVFTTSQPFTSQSTGRTTFTATTKNKESLDNLTQYDKNENGYAILKNYRTQDTTPTFANVQVEYGSTATTYTPYVSQTNPINLGEYELGTIGDYKNRVFKNIPTDEDYSSEREEGGWYYKQGIGKVVLDGTEDIVLDTTKTITQVFKIRDVLSKGVQDSLGFCNYFINQPGDTEKFSYLANDATDYKNLYIAINKTTASTIQEFKTWLSTHNTILIYPLSTPTYTKITGELAEQLEQVYKGMLSYDGVTNISQVNNDLAFVINASGITK